MTLSESEMNDNWRDRIHTFRENGRYIVWSPRFHAEMIWMDVGTSHTLVIARYAGLINAALDHMRNDLFTEINEQSQRTLLIFVDCRDFDAGTVFSHETPTFVERQWFFGLDTAGLDWFEKHLTADEKSLVLKGDADPVFIAEGDRYGFSLDTIRNLLPSVHTIPDLLKAINAIPPNHARAYAMDLAARSNVSESLLLHKLAGHELPVPTVNGSFASSSGGDRRQWG